MKNFIYLLFTLVIGSCASIPREAPMLSEQLGKEIVELESSHMRLVEAFFELKRKNVRTFIEEVWLPEYARSFFGKPDIKLMWEHVASEGSEEDRLKFLLVTAPELQVDIDRQYQTSVAELNLLEGTLKKALREKYMNSRSINNTITSFLVSASEVQENRQRYLDMAGITQDKIGGIIEKADSFTSEFLNKTIDANNKVEGAEENLQDYRRKIKSLIENLK